MFYNEDSFEELIAEVLNHAKNRIETIVNNWCMDANLKEPVGYYLSYDKKYYRYIQQDLVC